MISKTKQIGLDCRDTAPLGMSYKEKSQSPGVVHPCPNVRQAGALTTEIEGDLL